MFGTGFAKENISRNDFQLLAETTFAEIGLQPDPTTARISRSFELNEYVAQDSAGNLDVRVMHWNYGTDRELSPLRSSHDDGPYFFRGLLRDEDAELKVTIKPEKYM